MQVGVMIPCCVDQFSTQTAQNMINLLKRLDINYFYPEEFTCCGKELYLEGDTDAASALGGKMMDLFGQMDYVVTCSSGCAAYVKKYFPKLFFNTAFHNSNQSFADRFLDLSDFLVNVVHFDASQVIFPHKVTFLDHCTTLRDYGLKDEPRKLLKQVSDLQYVEMNQQEVCCGAGNGFSRRFAPVAGELSRMKIENALAVGAEYIVSTEPSCLMHLQAYASKHKINIQCIHLADLLAQ